MFQKQNKNKMQQFYIDEKGNEIKERPPVNTGIEETPYNKEEAIRKSAANDIYNIFSETKTPVEKIIDFGFNEFTANNKKHRLVDMFGIREKQAKEIFSYGIKFAQYYSRLLTVQGKNKKADFEPFPELPEDFTF